MKNTAITQEYADKIRPLISLAHRAYGAKSQNTPAHQASREYTRLLVEFVEKNGSLMKLSQALEVSYSGLRRRVFSASVPPMSNKSTTSRVRPAPEVIDAAVERVRVARATSTEKYHEQLAKEYYETGVSLSAIAKGLGISNAGPLYYGVQRHVQRLARV